MFCLSGRCDCCFRLTDRWYLKVLSTLCQQLQYCLKSPVLSYFKVLETVYLAPKVPHQYTHFCVRRSALRWFDKRPLIATYRAIDPGSAVPQSSAAEAKLPPLKPSGGSTSSSSIFFFFLLLFITDHKARPELRLAGSFISTFPASVSSLRIKC